MSYFSNGLEVPNGTQGTQQGATFSFRVVLFMSKSWFVIGLSYALFRKPVNDVCGVPKQVHSASFYNFPYLHKWTPMAPNMFALWVWGFFD